MELSFGGRGSFFPTVKWPRYFWSLLQLHHWVICSVIFLKTAAGIYLQQLELSSLYLMQYLYSFQVTQLFSQHFCCHQIHFQLFWLHTKHGNSMVHLAIFQFSNNFFVIHRCHRQDIKYNLQSKGTVGKVQKCLLFLMESGVIYSLCWVSMHIFLCIAWLNLTSKIRC